ncbi:hypothetical protein nrt1_30860 [Pseudomonas aeruginosa]
MPIEHQLPLDAIVLTFEETPVTCRAGAIRQVAQSLVEAPPMNIGATRIFMPGQYLLAPVVTAEPAEMPFLAAGTAVTATADLDDHAVLYAASPRSHQMTSQAVTSSTANVPLHSVVEGGQRNCQAYRKDQ